MSNSARPRRTPLRRAGRFQKYLFRREARLLERIERRLCDKAAFVFTLADEDRAALGVDTPGKSAALAACDAGLDPRGLPANRSPTYDAALIGTWTWQPNRIGLEWFLEKVVPHLPDEFRIAIAGKVPSGIGSAHPGVSFVGRVDDAIEFVLQRPRRRAGQPRRQRRPAEDHRDLRARPAGRCDLALAARDRDASGKLHHRRRAGRVRRALREAALGARDIEAGRFRSDQRQALDRQLRLGLRALGYQGERAHA